MRCSSRENLWDQCSMREESDISSNPSEISELRMPTCNREGLIPRVKYMWTRQNATVKYGVIVLLIAMVIASSYVYYDEIVSLFETEVISTRARRKIKKKAECPAKAGTNRGSAWAIGFS